MRSAFGTRVAAALLVVCTAVQARHAAHELSVSEHVQYASMMEAIDNGNLQSFKEQIKAGIDLALREDTRASPAFLTKAAFLGRNDIVGIFG